MTFTHAWSPSRRTGRHSVSLPSHLILDSLWGGFSLPGTLVPALVQICNKLAPPPATRAAPNSSSQKYSFREIERIGAKMKIIWLVSWSTLLRAVGAAPLLLALSMGARAKTY